jgi:predicted phosphoadenosine phosphosulfate sulfurtransferase
LFDKVYLKTYEQLGIHGYRDRDSFQVFICPVKAREGREDAHPVLLTYSTWGAYSQSLIWRMDMIPLSDSERSDIWYGVVENDSCYYQLYSYMDFD